ncbi:MAG: FISUMP domain-containing protein [Bacteroidota bacterium]
MLGKICVFFLLLTGFTCAPTSPQSTTIQAGAPLTDPRDQQVYPTIQVGAQRWLASDLKFETPSSFCYNNTPSHCQQYGRLYNFNEAKKACPPGWKLPDEREWQALERALGMPPTQADSIRIWRGQQEGRRMIEELNIPFAGIAKLKGKNFNSLGKIARYWVDQPGPAGPNFVLYRMLMRGEARIYSDQIARVHLCCARCIEKQ